MGWVSGRVGAHRQYSFKNRDSYHGHWRKGKMHGRGVYTYANETKYTVRAGCWNSAQST